MTLFQRLFQIYPGEGKRVVIASLLTFLGSFAIAAGMALGDGRFLEEVGPQGLPTAYLLTSLAMLASASFMLFAFSRFNARKVFTFIMTATATTYGCIAVALVIGGSQNFTWYALKIAGDTLDVLLFTGMWSFVDYTFPLQEAKRLYGFFSAAFVIGLATGGAFISFAIMRLETTGVLVVLTCVLFASLMLLARPQKNAPRVKRAKKVGARELFKQVMTSRFTLFFLILNVLIAVLEIVTKASYLNALEAVLGPMGEHEVTRFIGKWRGWLYIADMIFGALIYSRLVKKAGVNRVGLIPAGAFFLLFLTWPLMGGGILLGIFGLIAAEGILIAVDDPNFNLQLKAVPAAIKTPFRITSEHVVEPVGMLLASLLLQLQGGARWVGLVVSCLALGAAFMMRRTYKKAIYANLVATDEGSIEEDLVIEFNEEDEECLRLSKLAIEGSPHHFEAILSQLRHASIDAKRTAMGALAKLATPAAARHTWRLLEELKACDDQQFRSLGLLTIKRTCRLEQMRPLVLSIPGLRGWEQKRILEILIGFGPQAAPLLLKMTQNTDLDYASRLVTGKALYKIAPTTLRTHLTSLVSKEIDRAYLYTYHGLTSVCDASIELISHLIGMAGGVDDSRLLTRSLQHTDQDIHSHAVETLEKCCPPKLFAKVLPLIDRKATQKLLYNYLKKRDYPLTTDDLMAYLKSSSSPLEVEIVSNSAQAAVES